MSDDSARLLERALVFSFIAHGVAMLSMALLLLPSMPGAAGTGDVDRMHHIASHAFAFRLGWFPWQVTALSDVLIGLGLVRTRWIPKVPAALTLFVTLLAVVPDQAGQVAWMTRGVELAREGNLPVYLAYEEVVFRWTAAWGGSLYTVAALGWTACFVAGGAWSTSLTVVSLVVWPLFTYVNAGPLLPPAIRPSAAFVASGNALGFVLLEAWLALVTVRVRRRPQPPAR